MNKTTQRRLAQQQAVEDAGYERDIAAGKRFVVHWKHDNAPAPGTLRFASAEEALAHAEKMIAENRIKIPSDYYERQAYITWMSVSVVEVGGAVLREREQFAVRVTYVDDRGW